MVPAMRLTAPSSAVQPDIRRELIKLLYTAMPQVMAITVTSVTGAVALTLVTGDIGYAWASCLIMVTAAGRLVSLRLYQSRATRFSDQDVLRWEHIYGIGAMAFSVGLGLLSYRALRLGDAGGAWISFGLSMSYCVGMVSRAAVRPWIVLSASAVLFAPTIVAGLLRPELAYKLGACMLFLFWIMLREASRHLSQAFIERLEAQQALARQAHHDFLTDLPNRAAFLSAWETATGRVAVIAVDLDGFKSINDRFGHHAGDSLLRQVAERLTACIGPDGTVARFGGDEFMLLRPVDGGSAGEDAAVALAKRVVEALSLPFFLANEPARIGASAGILVTERAVGAEIGTDSLLEQVDRALYAAKRAGGGQWQWSGGQDTMLDEAI